METTPRYGFRWYPEYVFDVRKPGTRQRMKIPVLKRPGQSIDDLKAIVAQKVAAAFGLSVVEAQKWLTGKFREMPNQRIAARNLGNRDGWKPLYPEAKPQPLAKNGDLRSLS